MAFLNEHLTDEDRASFDWQRLQRWPGDGSGVVNPTEWTIDRERKIFFMEICSGLREFGPPRTYAFSWKDAFVRIVACSFRPDSKNHSSLKWKVFSVEIPTDISHLREQVISDLKEAIGVFGVLYGREKYEETQVEIMNHPYKEAAEAWWQWMYNTIDGRAP